MNIVEHFLHYIDKTNEKAGLVVSFVLAPLVIVTITEVIARYVFNSPTIWAWDVNMQIFGIVVPLSGGYILLKERHTRIDAVLVYLPQKGKLICELIGMLLLMYVAVILIWQGAIAGWDSFVARETIYSMWSPPVYHIKMLFPVAGLLLFFQGLAKFIRDFLTLLGRKEYRDIS